MTEFKQPGEKLVYAYDFTNKLAGETITGITSATSDARSGDTELTKVAESYVDDPIVKVAWSGGTDGETYSTRVLITDGSGQIHELDGEIIVADLSFSVPTGITSTYLTAEEYVDRFTIEETVSLTDERGTETVGVALGKALVSVSSRIEGSLRARYTLPLAEVPEMLKDIAADLARERLFTLRPVDEVTRRADLARSDLDKIAKGQILLVTGDEAIEGDAADIPVVYAPDQIFTDCVLGSYRGRMQ